MPKAEQMLHHKRHATHIVGRDAADVRVFDVVVNQDGGMFQTFQLFIVLVGCVQPKNQRTLQAVLPHDLIVAKHVVAQAADHHFEAVLCGGTFEGQCDLIQIIGDLLELHAFQKHAYALVREVFGLSDIPHAGSHLQNLGTGVFVDVSPAVERLINGAGAQPHLPCDVLNLDHMIPSCLVFVF